MKSLEMHKEMNQTWYRMKEAMKAGILTALDEALKTFSTNQVM